MTSKSEEAGVFWPPQPEQVEMLIGHVIGLCAAMDLAFTALPSEMD
jgi:hypothetical protein